MEENRQHNTLRNVGILAILLLVFMAGIGAGIVTFAAVRGDPPVPVPSVVGQTYDEAASSLEGAGFVVHAEPGRGARDIADPGSRAIESQAPAAGTALARGATVIVYLKKAEAPRVSRIVCVDPGHSNRTGSEIDSETGLNVGDNGGATGEIQSNWELAQKLKAKLEAAGYKVKLTKTSADSYVSLRERADIGNTCDVMVRLHYDDEGFTGVMRPPLNAARAPSSDPGRITVVSEKVATESDRLARDIASFLGIAVRDDTAGTTQGNTTVTGHPGCLIGSCLSEVPLVTIENSMSLVRNNPSGQDQVADQIAKGVARYFDGK